VNCIECSTYQIAKKTVFGERLCATLCPLEMEKATIPPQAHKAYLGGTIFYKEAHRKKAEEDVGGKIGNGITSDVQLYLLRM